MYKFEIFYYYYYYFYYVYETVQHTSNMHIIQGIKKITKLQTKT